MTHRELAGHGLLQRSGLLEPLTTPQRATLAGEAQLVTIESDQAIYAPGDAVGHVYLLGAGVVRLGGRRLERPLVHLYPGDIFGETAVFAAGPRDHRAEARHGAVISALPAPLVRSLIRSNPAFGRQIGRLLAARLAGLQTRVLELMHTSARARVAHVLLTLARRFGSAVGSSVLVPVGMRQQDVAGLAGVRRETASGILREFRDRGIACLTPRGMRLAKNIRTAGVRAQLTADLFNVFNSNTELNRLRNLDSPNFNLLTQNLSPRILRFGVRLGF